MRHVVAVAEVGEGEPGQPALLLPDGLQVGERLARVRVVGERVDDGDRRRLGEPLDPVLAEGADDDRRDVAGQDLRGVLDRLAATELGAARVDDDRVTAELGDAGFERQPGPGRGLLEDDRDRARPGQRS
jgi:hypothetical protein